MKLKHTYFILDGEIDEVGIHQNTIRGSQRSIVLKEKSRRMNRTKESKFRTYDLEPKKNFGGGGGI